MRQMLNLLLLLIVYSNKIHKAYAADIWVDSSSASTYPGCGSEGNPCATISDGFLSATTGDTLNLAPGIYTGDGNEGLGGSNQPTITLLSLIGTGASPKDVQIICSRPHRFLTIANEFVVALQNMYVHNCSNILEDEIGGQGGAIDATNTSLVISNCLFENNFAYLGGALSSDLSSLTVRNSTFRNNRAGLVGGAMSYSRMHSLHLEECIFESNAAIGEPIAMQNVETAGRGGALFVGYKCLVYISDCFFRNNTAMNSGGAVHQQFSTFTLISNTDFDSNTVQGSGDCLVDSSCEVRGGAYYAKDVSMDVYNCSFRNNAAITTSLSQFAEGGALYVASDSISTDSSSISNCTFVNNSAQGRGDNNAGGYGGGIYVKRVPVSVSRCDFVGNSVSSDGLFTEFSSNGGALWMSSSSNSVISNCSFEANAAFGGRSGGVYVTDSSTATLSNCTFIDNIATSSYVFKAQGGAMSVTHQAIATILNSHFYNNMALPREELVPRTYSGEGGGIFIQSAAATIRDSDFINNHAATGQFDSGATGGALSLEDSTNVLIYNSKFYFNSARGFSQSNSYSSSGTGGAISIMFSTADISQCDFYLNWVSAGGSEYSIGGAVAIFYELTPTTSQPVKFTDCVFEYNVAAGEVCSSLQIDRSGQGGAVAIVGTTTAGVVFRNVQFIKNLASTESTGVISSFGGALMYSQGSIVSMQNATYYHNVAWNGYGNDISTAFDSSDDDLFLSMNASSFTAASYTDMKKIHDIVYAAISQYCGSLFTGATKASYITRIYLNGGPSQTRQLISDMKNQRTNPLRRRMLLDVTEENGAMMEAWSSNEHRRRSLQNKEFPTTTSLMVVSGTASMSDPQFDGLYGIFVGNFVSVFLGEDATNMRPARLLISGKMDIPELVIAAFDANVTIWNPDPATEVPLYSLIFVNSTLSFSNNVTVYRESVLMGSMLISTLTNSSSFFVNKVPFFNFESKLHTGFESHSNVDDIPIIEHLETLFYDPLTRLVHCALRINGELYVSATTAANSSIPSQSSSIIALHDGAYIYISATGALKIYARVTMVADSPSDIPLVNNGRVFIGYSPSKPVNTLSIHGVFAQSQVGVTTVVLSEDLTQQDPVIRMSSNISFFGVLNISVAPGTNFTLYKPYDASSWPLLAYDNVSQPIEVSTWSRYKVHSPEGLEFTIIPQGGYNAEYRYMDIVEIEAMQCDLVEQFYFFDGISDQDYHCNVCLKNTSCGFCGNSEDNSNVCVNRKGCSGGFEYHNKNCCPEMCNGHGECHTSNDKKSVSCVCNFFYAGDSCADFSVSAILLISGSVFAFLLGLLTLRYYFYYRRQKHKVLEELRMGLLTNDGGNNNEKYVPKTYLQSIQQDLILRDVFVNYSELTLEGKIGEGSFGVVHKATFRGAQVAVKQMRTPVFMHLSASDIEEFRKEAYMMSRLRHPNIVLVMGISLIDHEVVTPPGFEDDDDVPPEKDRGRILSLDRINPSKEPTPKKSVFKSVCIITEYLDQGSLADVLYGQNRVSDEIWTYELILTCALQAARGMLYLHSHTPPIVHRDLKSSNLVIDDHFVVKVTDFGMSRIVPSKLQDMDKGIALPPPELLRSPSTPSMQQSVDSPNTPEHESDEQTWDNGPERESFSRPERPSIGGDYLEMTSNLGTTAWCAPELLTSGNKTRYSVKVDVYSFGVVLWELWERKRPFEEFQSRFDIIDAIRAGKRPPISASCPPAFRSLIQRCWHDQPARRPTFAYIVRYLKDELAHIKRQRLASGVSGLSSTTAPSFRMFSAASSSSRSAEAQKLTEELRGGETPVTGQYYEYNEGESSGASSALNRLLPSWAKPKSPPIGIKKIKSPSADDLTQLARSPEDAAPPSTEQPQWQQPQRSQGTWRNRYVMKFGGWDASKPDSRLPPPAPSPARAVKQREVVTSPLIFPESSEARDSFSTGSEDDTPKSPAYVPTSPPGSSHELSKIIEGADEYRAREKSNSF